MTRQQFIEHVAMEQESLRRFLLALCCGDRMLAEDIAQESFIKAYLALESYHEQYKFSTWLFRIAHNVFVDTCRKKSSTEIELDSVKIVDNESDADREFIYQELYMALDTLAIQERTAILLYYIQGYSIREIGLITGYSEDAVKMQLSRGRRHLKIKLDYGR